MVRSSYRFGVGGTTPKFFKRKRDLEALKSTKSPVSAGGGKGSTSPAKLRHTGSQKYTGWAMKPHSDFA
jgi:hypothetical protein